MEGAEWWVVVALWLLVTMLHSALRVGVHWTVQAAQYLAHLNYPFAGKVNFPLNACSW